MLVKKIHYSEMDSYLFSLTEELKEGDLACFWQSSEEFTTVYEVGKTYIGNFSYHIGYSNEYDTPVYRVRGAPFSSQYNKGSSTLIEDGVLPTEAIRFDEVIESFWDGNGRIMDIVITDTRRLWLALEMQEQVHIFFC